MNFSPKPSHLVRIAMPRALALAALAITGMILAGAAPAYCFPWSIDMFRGSTVQPLAVAPRVMPEGTLPVNGIHDNIHYGQPAAWESLEPALHPMTLEQMTVRLHNPYKPTPERLSHGKFLYLTDCAPCHGDNGKGDGPVAHLLRHPPFDLMKDVVRNIPDGFIYGYIRNGGIWMPSYNDSMSQPERWDVVIYLRDLEAKTPPEKETSTSSATASTSVASK
ncbi:MAG: c-type cytochrome [Candidatus Binataceae bacterium]